MTQYSHVQVYDSRVAEHLVRNMRLCAGIARFAQRAFLPSEACNGSLKLYSQQPCALQHPGPWPHPNTRQRRFRSRDHGDCLRSPCNLSGPLWWLCLRDAPTRCYATIRLSLVGGPTYLAAQAGASPSLRLHSCQQFVLPVVQQSSVVPDVDKGVAGDLPSLQTQQPEVTKRVTALPRS